MSYREPPRISQVGKVLRYYASVIESNCIKPPPPHLLSKDETVDAFRYLGMLVDIEVGKRQNEAEVAASAADYSAVMFGERPSVDQNNGEKEVAVSSARALVGYPDMRKRIDARRETPADQTGDGENGRADGAASSLVPDPAPRPRRRRGPR